MSVVQVYVSKAAGPSLIGILHSDILKKYSLLATELLSAQPASTKYEITLFGAAPAATKFILDQMLAARPGRPFFLDTKDLPVERVAAIHQAAMILKLVPEQKGLRAHVMGWVAHHIPTPAQLETLHLVYKDASSSIWRAMVHNIAYHVVGGDIPEPLATELNDAGSKHLALDQAVLLKIDELKGKRQLGRMIQAKKQTRRGKRESTMGGSWESGLEDGQRAINQALVENIMGMW